MTYRQHHLPNEIRGAVNLFKSAFILVKSNTCRFPEKNTPVKTGSKTQPVKKEQFPLERLFSGNYVFSTAPLFFYFPKKKVKLILQNFIELHYLRWFWFSGIAVVGEKYRDSNKKKSMKLNFEQNFPVDTSPIIIWE